MTRVRVALAALLLTGFVAAGPSSTLAQSPDPVPFGDAHVHLNDPEGWLDLMDENDIGRAIVMRGLMELARRYQVPVSVHVEITRLPDFETLLETFPDVTVIWSHAGYAPMHLARAMIEAHPNLILELSARTWPRHPRSPDYTILMNGVDVWPEWLALIERFPDRVVMGTDAAGRSTDSARISSVQRVLDQLSPETRRRVAHGNLDRILRIGGGG